MRRIHQAPLLLPMGGPAIANGALAVADGRIVDLGPADQVKAAGGELIVHDDCLLMPGLVNGHAHLELAIHAGQIPGPQKPGDMVGWVRQLLRLRAGSVEQQQQKQQAAAACWQQMQAEGVALLVDIGNEPAWLDQTCQPQQTMKGYHFGMGCLQPLGNLSYNPPLVAAQGEIVFLREVLGLSQARQEAACQLMARESGPVTVHAPHSTAAPLLRQVKERASQRGTLFSLHVAESRAECAFLATGEGDFRTFLEEMGGWDGSFKPPGCGPVDYLDSLGLLDEHTLCVHAIHLSQDDIALLARRGAGVCLCPGSNRFLGVGKAPLPELLAAGILPALGTDSAASNERLSLWREMRLLAADHPAIDPQIIVRMATVGGAMAVGQGRSHGVLAPGRAARVLAVRCPDMNNPFDFLVHDPAEKEVEWL